MAAKKPAVPVRASAKSAPAPRQQAPATASRPVSTGRGSAGAAAAPAPAKATRKPAPAPEPEVIEEELIETEEAASEEFVDGQSDVAEEATSASGDEILDLSTEELDSPARKADVHRGRVTEIIEHHSETKGTPAIRIVLHSDDADFDTKMDVYVPLPFEADIRINPRELSKVKDEDAGTKNEQLQFAMGIHNKKNDATVDKLRLIAKEEGRSLADYQGPVETFSDYCAALNTLCADMPIIFFRRPQKDSPQFLEVHDLLSMNALDNPKMAGRFKGKVLAWAATE